MSEADKDVAGLEAAAALEAARIVSKYGLIGVTGNCTTALEIAFIKGATYQQGIDNERALKMLDNIKGA